MEFSLTTPALLFPAVSLLLLAYTNRFLALASLIRNLHATYKTNPDKVLLDQINNLRHRVILIKNMQAIGIWSLFLCVLCMFVLFAGYYVIGQYIFGISLILLMWSLALSIRETQISVNALNLHLKDIERIEKLEG
jgi:hypothetical protein